MRKWLIRRWDMFVYRLAYKSLKRMCEQRVGFAYLTELWLRHWRSQNPLPKNIETATEQFFESIVNHKQQVTDESQGLSNQVQGSDV